MILLRRLPLSLDYKMKTISTLHFSYALLFSKDKIIHHLYQWTQELTKFSSPSYFFSNLPESKRPQTLHFLFNDPKRFDIISLIWAIVILHSNFSRYMDLIFPLENSANQQYKGAEIILTLILTHLREAPNFF